MRLQGLGKLKNAMNLLLKSLVEGSDSGLNHFIYYCTSLSFHLPYAMKGYQLLDCHKTYFGNNFGFLVKYKFYSFDWEEAVIHFRNIYRRRY
jgi:hypothetical protein